MGFPLEHWKILVHNLKIQKTSTSRNAMAQVAPLHCQGTFHWMLVLSSNLNFKMSRTSVATQWGACRGAQTQIKLKWRNIPNRAHPKPSPLLSPPHLQSWSQLLMAFLVRFTLPIASLSHISFLTSPERKGINILNSGPINVPAGTHFLQDHAPLWQQLEISDQKMKQIFKKVK